MTNCKNCGAPLQKNKCDYCGTNYQPTAPTLIKAVKQKNKISIPPIFILLIGISSIILLKKLIKKITHEII